MLADIQLLPTLFTFACFVTVYFVSLWLLLKHCTPQILGQSRLQSTTGRLIYC